MNQLVTYGLVALSGISIVATVDSAFGLGGGALLADICRTWLENEPSRSGMSDMMMEVKPVPLILLSLAATSAAIFTLTNEHRSAMAGRSAPSNEERAAILSAMLIVAVAQGRTSPDEIKTVFRIVTGHGLDDDLANFVYGRFRDMVDAQQIDFKLSPVSSKIGRRRTLAAALMVGCTDRPTTVEMPALLERIASDVGATSEDVQAAQDALQAWQEGFEPMQAISPIVMLSHRLLRLSPA